MEPHLSPGWYQGRLPPGVAFGLNAPIRVAAGDQAGATGSVIGLIAVSPEPRYLVELASGVDVELGQSSLLAD
jgi:hypothetical protein